MQKTRDNGHAKILRLLEQKHNREKLENEMLSRLRMEAFSNPDFPLWTREYRFHEKRKWRFDFAWVQNDVALEVEGLQAPWQKSRHTTNKGFAQDCRKYSEAAIAGFCVIRVTGGMIKSGEAMDLLRRALKIPAKAGV